VQVSIATRRKSHITDLFLLILLLLIIFVVVILIFIIITFLAMVRIAIVFKILSRLLLTLHASLSELFHHLKKFLPIILEKVVRNSENITCEYRVKWHVSGHTTKKLQNFAHAPVTARLFQLKSPSPLAIFPFGAARRSRPP
jgi:hypothetical protein